MIGGGNEAQVLPGLSQAPVDRVTERETADFRLDLQSMRGTEGEPLIQEAPGVLRLPLANVPLQDAVPRMPDTPEILTPMTSSGQSGASPPTIYEGNELQKA